MGRFRGDGLPGTKNIHFLGFQHQGRKEACFHSCPDGCVGVGVECNIRMFPSFRVCTLHPLPLNIAEITTQKSAWQHTHLQRRWNCVIGVTHKHLRWASATGPKKQRWLLWWPGHQLLRCNDGTSSWLLQTSDWKPQNQTPASSQGCLQ